MALDTKTTCRPQTYPCKTEDRLSASKNDLDDILASWCRGVNYREHRECSQLARRLYETFQDAAFRKTRDGLQLGGRGIVVLVDTFPVGYGKFREVRLSTGEVVVGFAELKEIPTRFHFEILDERKTIVNLVKTLIRPGSTLIVDDSLSQTLKDLPYTVTTVEELRKHDTGTQSVLKNLETVWRPILDSCANAEDFFDIRNVLAAIMWRQRYGRESTAMLNEEVG